MKENPVKIPIYLDYMATTPVDPQVKKKMIEYLDSDGVFGNSSSRNHCYGWVADEAIEKARQQVADLVHAEPQSIIWTSGATEADNLAIKGAAHFYKRKGRHIVTCKTEHKAVLDACAALEQEGFEVTYLTPQSNGLINLNQLDEALRKDTVLLSIMHVNNEIGVIQDLVKIGELARAKGVLFHVDAAQSAGKIPINLSALPVDLMSFSAHKVYGPKGIGALYVRQKPKVRLAPLIHGGGHEQGLRSGTLPTHQIVGMGEAFELAKNNLAKENSYLSNLRHCLWEGICELDGVTANGDLVRRIPGNLNISFQGIDGESLLVGLKDLAISTGSACTSAHIEPSYVLRAIGLSDQLAHSSLRFSIGRFTTPEEIDYAIEHIKTVVRKLRAMAP